MAATRPRRSFDALDFDRMPVGHSDEGGQLCAFDDALKVLADMDAAARTVGGAPIVPRADASRASGDSAGVAADGDARLDAGSRMACPRGEGG